MQLRLLFTLIGSYDLLQDNITDLWLNTCYIAFNRTGYMYEKYNAYQVGVGGGGGEYTPQVGFGWSNAVALILLQQQYPFFMDDDSGGGGGGLSSNAVTALVCAAVFVGMLIGVLLFFHVYAPVRTTAVPAEPVVTMTPMKQPV
jgi:hypothetical protein